MRWTSCLLSYPLSIAIVFLLLCTPAIDSSKDQYRRCRELYKSTKVGEVIDESLLPLQSYSSSTIPVVPSLQGFYDGTCELCDNNNFVLEDAATMSVNVNNKTRAFVLATTASPSLEKSLIVTAGLLTSKAHVTIITGPSMPDSSLIRQVLFQHIPCDQHLVANMLLDFKQMHIDFKHLPCPVYMVDPNTQSPNDILMCNIQNAEVLFNSLSDIIQRTTTKPTVFITDVTCIAGIIAAEKWKIPIILMVENADVFLRYIFGPPRIVSISRTNMLKSRTTTTRTRRTTTKTKTKTTASSASRMTINPIEWGNSILDILTETMVYYLNPRIWYQSLSWSIQDRFNSMDVSIAFIHLNRVRTKLKLHRVRLLSDMWKIGGSVLLFNRKARIISINNNNNNRIPKKSFFGSSRNNNNRNINYNNTINNNDYDDDDDDEKVDFIEERGWGHVLPNLYTIPDPLLPPCVSCTAAPITTRTVQKNKKPISMSKSRDSLSTRDNNDNIDDIPSLVLSVAFRNDEKGRSGSRRLLLGFWLALQSVKQLSANRCNTTKDGVIVYTNNCWNGPSSFQIVRPGIMPEVLPPGNDNLNDGSSKFVKKQHFITAEETTYLDTLARHQPIAMLSVCDESNVWTQSLGPPVLCIDTTWPARKIAFSIVDLMKNINSKTFGNNFYIRNDTVPTSNQYDAATTVRKKTVRTIPAIMKRLDGLEWIITLVERLSMLRERKENEWKNDWQMGNDVAQEIDKMLRNVTAIDEESTSTIQITPENHDDGNDQNLFDLLSFYLAWIVLCGSVMYILISEYATNLPYQQYRLLLYNYFGHPLHSNSVISNNNSYDTVGTKFENSKNDCNHHHVACEQKQHQQQQHHYWYTMLDFTSLSIVLQDVFIRLLDLNHAYSMWKGWVRETLRMWNTNDDESDYSSPTQHQQPSTIKTHHLHSSSLRHNNSNSNNNKMSSQYVSTTTNHNGMNGSANNNGDVLINNQNGSTTNGHVRKRRSVKKRH